MIQRNDKNNSSFKDKSDLVNDTDLKNDINDSLSARDKDRIWIGVEDKIGQYYQKKHSQYTMLRVACALLLFGVISFLIYTTNQNFTLTDQFNVVSIIPGSDRAILTLEDGRKIDLTSQDQDDLKSAGVDFVKTENGEIVYKISAALDKSAKGFNTITTPRGGQYRIILPDDSEVLLNASSSLRFAKNINEQSVRIVELTGEGFFKVQNSDLKPFIVETHAQQIQVLGTVFNVNSYDKSNVYTTLLEGSVQLNKQSVLKPGQQGISAYISQKPIIKRVEVSDYVDWVNKQFVFRDESIKDIMIRLSRWYDFEVIYSSSVDQSITFNGELSRYADVNDILKSLSKTSSLKFEIKDKTIIVR